MNKQSYFVTYCSKGGPEVMQVMATDAANAGELVEAFLPGILLIETEEEYETRTGKRSVPMNQERYEKARWLHERGIYIGPRDPNRNRAFSGCWMVAEDLNAGPTDDARTGGFCIVGDDLGRIIDDAYGFFNG